MKAINVFFLIALAVIPSACATKIIHTNTDLAASAPHDLTEIEAKKVLFDMMTRNTGERFKFRDLEVDANGVTYKFVENNELFGVITTNVSLPFNGDYSITSREDGNFKDVFRFTNHGDDILLLNWDTQKEAEEFAGAFFALKRIKESKATPVDESSLKEFESVAAAFKASKSKPALSEEAHMYSVQASDAAKNHRYEDALGLYAKALAIAPWWPEGHYNSALVSATLERYGPAITEMKKYLLLVPEAPNARAAQDKIYIWQGRMQ